MKYKEGYFNYRSKVVDGKMKLVRKEININGEFGTIGGNNSDSDSNSNSNNSNSNSNSKYEYETQPFYFLSESDNFNFFISTDPLLLYVVSKNDIHISEDLIYSNKENKVKGEVIDELISSKFNDDEVIQEAIKRHLDKNYKSYILFRSFADRQFGNTLCFEEMYGIYKNNGKIRNDKMIEELFYLCKNNKCNNWIKRDKRLKKIIKQNNENK